MRALSIRQPWASLIVDSTKRIENRSRRTHVRGAVLIHASQKLDWRELDSAASLSLSRKFGDAAPRLPAICKEGGWINADGSPVLHGGIIGVGVIYGCADEAASFPRATRPWFVGPWGWYLSEVHPVPFLPCKGSLGFFEVTPPAEWLLQLSPQASKLIR